VDVEKTIEFILTQQARNEARVGAMEERHNREMQQIRDELRRGVRLAVQDARHERKRRQEMAEHWDQKITQLSAAQLVTEEKLQGLIEAMRQSKNGHP
jgi:CRISPR/Cas system-associated exonuclease Cas4 (RecB family)